MEIIFLFQDSDSFKPSEAALRSKYGHLLAKKKNNKDITTQSFSELVKGVTKKAMKQAKKNDVVSFIDIKKKKFTTNKKRKKPKVTEL